MQGKIAGQVRFAGAIVMSSDIDLSQPFTVLYDTGLQVESVEELAQVDYQVPPVAFSLATGAPLPAEFLPKSANPFPKFDDFEEVDEGVLATLINTSANSSAVSVTASTVGAGIRLTSHGSNPPITVTTSSSI